MAHYNTTILMAIALVIVRLSSTVPTDDKEASLTQGLLDGFEYGSSSAGPTDNEEELSRQELIKENNYFQSLNRGGYASPQKRIMEFDELETVRDMLNNTINEIDCNYTYDMLVFLKIMTPENYTNDELYKKVDTKCSNWAQHMLNARINSGFPLRRSPYNLWMFYFYMEKMKMFAKQDAKKEMNNLHEYMGHHFTERMYSCKYLRTKCFKNGSYEEELNSLDPDSALEKIIEACTHLSVMSESKLNLNFNLGLSLHINNVVEDNAIMNTIATSFGSSNEVGKVVETLKRSMYTAKNPMSSLSELINSLGDVHNDFLWVVKTIMLRIWGSFLENLKTIENPKSAEQVQTLLREQHLNDFSDLFQLNMNDHFMDLIKCNKEDDDLIKLTGKFLFGIIIQNKISRIILLLKKYESEKGKLASRKPESEILKTFNCQTSTLVDIANGIDYKIDTVRSSIRERILCAEVFVEYLKAKLNGVNFKILQSFVVFHNDVRQNTYSTFKLSEVI